MTYQEQYERKKGSLSQALELIQSNDVICLGGDCNEPMMFAGQLHTIAPRVENVQVIKSRIGEYPFLTMPGMAGHIQTNGFFFGKGFVEGVPQDNVQLLVSDLRDYADNLVEHRPCNVFVISVGPMDAAGNFHVGMSLLWEKEQFAAILEKPNHRIILEVNAQQPRVCSGLTIALEDVTMLYEVDEPLPILNEPLNPLAVDGMSEDSQVNRAIARNVSSLIQDGDCIQLGVGPLSADIADCLKSRNDLGLHTVMITKELLDLIDLGVITGREKNLDNEKHVFTFAGGDEALYERLSHTPNLAIRPASYVADPTVIARIHNMVAVNTLVEMDLTGQVCAESIGPKQLSGAGATCDFALGAIHARGGRSILAFPSRSASGVSKIQGMLHVGAAVSIPRNYVDYIVTEYGVAAMRGRSVWERSQALVAIAHPDVRDDLTEYAHKNHYF
ncbi:MAG: hypothetical protein LUD79_08470 [Oscillospiraceae bacterium]|nr:hypothetical protein [Oscillospiraceae bacterium]